MCNVYLCDYDIIALSETWLSSNFSTSELGLLNYVTYRSDRNPITSNCSRGGVVSLSILNKYHSRLLPVPVSPVEHLFVITKIDIDYIIIGNVYFPPNTDISVFNIHFDIINTLLLKFPYVKNIIMVGDYNLPKIHWLPSLNGFFPNLLNLNKTNLEFLSKLSFLNLYQFNNITNNTGSVLDLVLSNFNNLSVNKSTNPLIPCDNYHPGLLISIPIIVNKPIEYNLHMYNFFNCNYVDINFSLASVNWLVLFQNLCINEAVDLFYSIMYEIIDIFVPKIVKRNLNYPSWFSKNLKDLIFKKKIAHKLFKSSGLLSDYNIFSNLRAKCKFYSKIDYRNFINKTEKNLKTHPKQFWKFINSKRKNNFLPNCMYLDNEQLTTPTNIINAFSKYFSSVYENYDSIDVNYVLPIPPKVLLSSINSVSIELSEVFESIDSSSSPGPDLIPNVFLKNCKYTISPPLLYLFNLSLSSSIFPNAWKTSFVRPIPKSSDISNISNYRPISLLPLIPKIFEAIIANKIQFNLNNVIIDDQHGFRRNKSTMTNLLNFQTFYRTLFRGGLL